DAGGLLERGQQVRKQPRLLGGRRRRHRDRPAMGGERDTHGEERRKHTRSGHASSPFTKSSASRDVRASTSRSKKDRTGRSASTRPCSRYTTRFARRLTWPRLWLAKTSVMPPSPNSSISASTSRL